LPIAKRILAVLLPVLLVVQFAACADTRETVRKTLARRGATLDRNMLEVIPCLGDAIRTKYGVSASSSASNLQVQSTDPRYVKNVLEVKLTPDDAGVPAGETRTIVYELVNRGNSGSGVRYGVEADGPTPETWWDDAFAPLAACGAVRN
jgi:hypothetical protein